jgi:hypothetical protein
MRHSPPRLLAATQRGWYLLGAPDDLHALTQVVRPGSRVSFSFDDRFLIGAFDDQARQFVVEISA